MTRASSALTPNQCSSEDRPRMKMTYWLTTPAM